MKGIEEEQLKEINGGGANPIWIAFGIGVVITLVAGIIDGYTRPLSCNN